MSSSADRIVSLVPSWTETLFGFGVGDRVVGVTEWCVHPADRVAELPKVGGTKNPRLDAIRALAPDFVIANREENRKKDVETLVADGFRVWVSDARTVRRALDEMRELARLVDAGAQATAVIERCERAAEPHQGASRGWLRVFVPIWKAPWMTMNRDTYIHDLVHLCGGQNPFAGRDERYPRLTLGDIKAARPDVVLLPDEPYRFGAADADELRAVLPDARVHLIDGTYLSWYGPRIAEALPLVRRLIAGAARECL